jgi:hypothetical protein
LTRRSSTGPLETVADDAVPTGYETDTGRNCSTERVLQEQYGKTAAHEGYEAQSETDEVRHVSHLGLVLTRLDVAVYRKTQRKKMQLIYQLVV